MRPLDALDRANTVRRGNAQAKHAIRAAGRTAGARIAAKLVVGADCSLRFEALLLAVPRVGDKRARLMLGLAEINPLAKVNDPHITPRQRQALADQLDAYANGEPL